MRKTENFEFAANTVFPGYIVDFLTITCYNEGSIQEKGRF